MDKMLAVVLVFLVTAFQQASAIAVMEDGSVTIVCPLDGTYRYPVWTGPVTLASPLMTGNNFNEANFQWADSDLQDIRITQAMLKHNGTYTCRDDRDRTSTVELSVQYFKRPFMNIATESNGRTEMTCGAHSKPTLQIPVSVSTAASLDFNNPDTQITFHKCMPDPDYENRDYCSVTAIWYMNKPSNGKEQSCSFVHNNVTRLTLNKKAYFKFPPTMIKITGNMPITKGPTLTLTCATDSSYPVSILTWRKGTRTNVNDNPFITSDVDPVTMDAEYNGKKISQKLNLEVSNAINGQRVSCCVDDMCDSVTLEINITSAGVSNTAWLTLLMVCLLVTAKLQN